MTYGTDPWGRLTVPGSMLMGAAGPAVPPMPAARRSPKWPAVLAAFLKANPLCLGCGRRADTAHHETPVGVDASRELDPANLIPVCVPCHFVAAHCGSWNTYDPNPRATLAAHLKRVRAAKRI